MNQCSVSLGSQLLYIKSLRLGYRTYIDYIEAALAGLELSLDFVQNF